MAHQFRGSSGFGGGRLGLKYRVVLMQAVPYFVERFLFLYTRFELSILLGGIWLCKKMNPVRGAKEVVRRTLRVELFVIGAEYSDLLAWCPFLQATHDDSERGSFHKGDCKIRVAYLDERSHVIPHLITLRHARKTLSKNRCH